VTKLFAAAEGDMRLILALAAFGLRRGEICALKYGDVTTDGISVHADMIEDSDNKFHYKPLPKTYASIRFVRLPAQVIEMIGIGQPDDFIIDRTPNAVTHAFVRLRKSVGVNVRLHDLRHYYASVAAVLGVPDTYTADFGGWRRGSGTLKQVYQGLQDDAAVRFSDMISDHLSKVMQPQNATKD
jgi:integrase